MKNFRDLQVWHKAHSLTLASYRITNTFPKQEMYGLTSQIRRCAASVAANVAEGCGKRGNGEFYRFLNIALGSASELEHHFPLAYDLRSCQQRKLQTPGSQGCRDKANAGLFSLQSPSRSPSRVKLNAEC